MRKSSKVERGLFVMVCVMGMIAVLGFMNRCEAQLATKDEAVEKLEIWLANSEALIEVYDMVYEHDACATAAESLEGPLSAPPWIEVIRGIRENPIAAAENMHDLQGYPSAIRTLIGMFSDTSAATAKTWEYVGQQMFAGVEVEIPWPIRSGHGLKFKSALMENTMCADQTQG